MQFLLYGMGGGVKAQSCLEFVKGLSVFHFTMCSPFGLDSSVSSADASNPETLSLSLRSIAQHDDAMHQHWLGRPDDLASAHEPGSTSTAEGWEEINWEGATLSTEGDTDNVETSPEQKAAVATATTPVAPRLYKKHCLSSMCGLTNAQTD
jgi:hypothetical protein